jgi:hypothetical protein
MINKSINLDNPIYLFLKKHKCPNCGNKIVPKKIKKVVNSKSKEVKYFNFSCGDNYLIGDVNFTFFVFNCEMCKKDYEIDEIREFEKANQHLTNGNCCGRYSRPRGSIG